MTDERNPVLNPNILFENWAAQPVPDALVEDVMHPGVAHAHPLPPATAAMCALAKAAALNAPGALIERALDELIRSAMAEHLRDYHEGDR